MTRVLIVDDDALVRRFLSQMIPWEAEGFSLVGEARDGEEALHMLPETQPDIILADISMPIMSGIELIRKLKENSYPGGIIVLTCHDDFEYVKNAMQLGADEYILKNHLDAKTLHTALHATLTAITARAQKQQQEQQLHTLAQKGLLEERKSALHTLLQQPRISMEAQRELLQSVGIPLGFEHCYALMLRTECALEPAFVTVCQTIAEQHHGATIVLRKHALAVLVDVGAVPSLSTQFERIRTLCDALTVAATQELHTSMHIGVSELCIGAGALVAAVKQAEDALMFSFYREGVFYHSDTTLLQTNLPPEASAFVSGLPALLQSNFYALQTQIHAVTRAIEQHLPLPGIVMEWLQSCDQIAGKHRTQAQYAAMTKLSDISEGLLSYRMFLPGAAMQPVSISHSPAIRQSLHYIRTHFQTVCTLGEAANAAGLSPNYFSAQFKAELGVGFVEYVTDLRLAHVQSLMQNEHWDTLKSLAIRSGFSDYQHFCKVFKKKTGFSPAAYRQQVTHLS